MPKMKTHKGCAKRFKVTATGKVKYHKAGKGHLLSNKPGRTKQGLRKANVVTLKAVSKKIKWMMGEA